MSTEKALREAEARGYARAQAEIVSLLEGAVPKEREMAEARGYARGVEDAATYVYANYADYEWCKYAIRGIRALLKPKGEAKP